MSTVEEDSEFRDLLVQYLEKNGCLAQVKAELRASIFLALDEDIKVNKQQPLQNLQVQSYLETPEGRTMFCLVREFLEFFNLKFTISVYEPESYLDSIGQYEGRQKVAKDLGLDNIEEPTVPLLQQLVKIAQTKSKVLDINLDLSENINGSPKEDSLNEDSSYKKTELINSSSRNFTDLLVSPKNQHLENGNLNATFDIHSPTPANISKTKNDGQCEVEAPLNILHRQVILEEQNDSDSSKNLKLDQSNRNGDVSIDKNGTFEVNSPFITQNQTRISNDSFVPLPKCLLDIREDDTYEDTSSIAEDSEVMEKSSDVKTDVPLLKSLSLNSDNSVVTDSHIISKSEMEKPKLSHRSKSSLSSLLDLPTLSLNKTRVNNDILPSLYSKEFKNKSNLKDLDKMLDVDDENEGETMYSNDFSTMTVNSNQSKTNVSESESKSSSKVSKLKAVETKCSNVLIKNSNHSNKSSVSEYNTSESATSAQ